ncbi:hypothetical protein M5X02_23955 [Paenibacillus alvei]|uniref:hypothetical protein n=1 Tax=Paenibacillus alvei TaxID=44250 RepID=UPI0002888A8A|nr:hypothetical protein [Paenibacillus alvei]EJW14829.1 hypothetical protein PAV_11c01700 [Paenibacillus alvei DSM 29]MCY9543695.1 hypothetical protein [Paenibacillus alvei]MCY9708533.1 hypothetical protein [Paenibacillus alvei]MEC0083234.1 hypothetical protein [Paenibacillus alvei]
MNTTAIIEKVQEQLRIMEQTFTDMRTAWAEMGKHLEEAATIESEPLKREQVIEKAKEFVKSLGKPHHWYPEETVFTRGIFLHKAEFKINRKLRTVVCLLREFGDKKVSCRGIAKCMQGDAFNVHIGMAIALAKALGKEVPTEFVNAPQPDAPQVRDVVEVITGCIKGQQMTLIGKAPKYDTYVNGTAFRHTYDSGWLGSKQIKVIDDSRDGRYNDGMYTVGA